MIIGVVGTLASGKDSVAEYLARDKGFTHVSTADLLRDYIRDNGLGGLDRDNLRMVANRLRTEQGGDFLVKLALSRPERPIALTAMRSPVEVQAIHEAGGHVIAVDAPVTQRYAWARARGRIDDAVTEEQFKEQEEAEIVNTDPNHQQITAVIAMADFNIANDSTLEELYRKVDVILERYRNDKGQNPNAK